MFLKTMVIPHKNVIVMQYMYFRAQFCAPRYDVLRATERRPLDQHALPHDRNLKFTGLTLPRIQDWPNGSATSGGASGSSTTASPAMG